MIRNRPAAVTAAAFAFGAAIGVFGFAGAASAHVSVDPKEATQGGYARVAFRVPNESDSASTTKVEVVLPENAPVASVSAKPVPGWTVVVEQRKVNPPLDVHGSQVGEVPSKITWTASGDAAIKPGQFQEFPVSMGPLPAVDRMVFKTLQTYSDGNVVRWIEEPPANGGAKPDSPAPTLALVAASPSPPVAPSGRPEAATPDDDDNSAVLAVGIAGLVAGLAGLVLGGLAFARTRRPGGPPTA